jgi:hypothetical protein
LGADYGLDCYRHALPCFGDNRDTIYTSPLSVFKLGEDNSVITVGVNHHLTQMAEYTSMTMYDLKGTVGVTAINTADYSDSSRVFLEDDHDLADLAPLFYVVQWALNCDAVALPGVKCVTVTRENYPNMFNKYGVFIERAYVNPETGVGPDEVIGPMVLQVSTSKSKP